MAVPDPQAFDDGPIGQGLITIELGQKPWPSKDAKRHHFVPRFMLDRFATEGRIFQLDLHTGTPRGGIRTDRAASRHRLYEFEDEDGNKTNDIEGLFAVVERHAAPALSRLEEAGRVDDIDRATISMFLAFQWARTPAARERAERFVEEVSTGFMASSVSNRKEFEAMVRQREAEDDSFRMTPDEVEDLRQRTLHMLKEGSLVMRDPTGGATTGLLLQTANDIAMLLFGAMEWTLIRSSDTEFVTSDRAAASFDPTPRHPWSSHTIHSSPNVTTYFPVSAESCLAVSPGEPGLRVLDANRSQVMEVNLRIYGWASKYIYGRTQAALVAVRRAAKRKPQIAAPPKPHRSVILLPSDPDDDRLARAHVQRGWEPYMVTVDDLGYARTMDYMVVGEEGNAVEIAINADELVRRRAMKEAGLDPDSDAELPGGIRTEPVHPGTIKPSLW